jgi:riboflavin synthase
MVFSGIVEETGSVVSFEPSADVQLWDGTRGSGAVLVVAAAVVLEGAYEGCSIAVNGVCLTVTAFGGGRFTVGLAPETCVRAGLLRNGCTARRRRLTPAPDVGP